MATEGGSHVAIVSGLHHIRPESIKETYWDLIKLTAVRVYDTFPITQLWYHCPHRLILQGKQPAVPAGQLRRLELIPLPLTDRFKGNAYKQSSFVCLILC